ncbi:MAG: hypothetical protein ACO3VI_00030 [Ilumatobacteraceae bacterium]
MTVDDRTRLNLHQRLTEVLGSEEADTLMSHLPPVTWQEVATKGDLDSLRVVLTTDLRSAEAGIRSDMQTMESSIRGDMKATEASIRSDMKTMETVIRSDMKTMETEIRSDMKLLSAQIESVQHTLQIDMLKLFNRQTLMVTSSFVAWTSLMVVLTRMFG